MGRDQLRGFYILGLHVDNSQPQSEGSVELFEEIKIFAAATRKLQCQLLYICLQNRREKISVRSFPGGLSVTVAVTNVEGDLRVDPINQGVDDVHAPFDVFGKA